MLQTKENFQHCQDSIQLFFQRGRPVDHGSQLKDDLGLPLFPPQFAFGYIVHFIHDLEIHPCKGF